MQTISGTNYNIYFGTTGYESLASILLPSKYSKLFILVDENTSQHCLPHFLSNLATEIEIEIIELEAGEIHKNIATCTEVWGALSELGADRKSILVNLGGGVISDLGGFVACTFKRGIDFINIPTTLLAMVDASIGGKNGINFGEQKNLVGTFNLPSFILMDYSFLNSLPLDEFKNGFGEIIKYACLSDVRFFDMLFMHTIEDYQKDIHKIDALIQHCVSTKNKMVMADFKESHVRKLLNFNQFIQILF